MLLLKNANLYAPKAMGINDILIGGSKIFAINSSINLETNINFETIDLKGKTVVPGFIDSHTHPVFFETRENEFEMRIKGKTYVEISKAGGGIRNSISGVRNASEDELFGIGRLDLEDYVMLDISANYQLTERTEIYGRVENAGNVDYEEVTGYNTSGSAAYAGLRYSF